MEVDSKPKYEFTTNMLKENDPLGPFLKYFSATDTGFVKRACEFYFQIDCSAFIPLVHASYLAHSTFDNGFRQYVSFGMYQYYCVILLWRRLLYVTSPGTELFSAYQKLTRYLSFELPVPTDVSMYINSIGDVTDFTGRKFELHLQTYFTDDCVMGAQGTYGRIDEDNAVMYETLPSPFVALEKIRQDFSYTLAPQFLGVEVDWDLPRNIRPVHERATLPNANLLGWWRSEALTAEQRMVYADAGIDERSFNVTNIGRLPINQTLMKLVAGRIANSTCKAISPMSTIRAGSVAQIPYAVRSDEDNKIEESRGLGSKYLTTMCYSRPSSYVASMGATFRFRVQRRSANEKDTLCYRFAEPPAAWLANENCVFDAGNVAYWNVDDYWVPAQNGSTLHTELAERVRRQVSGD